MAIKLFSTCFGLLPLVPVDLSLFLEVNITVESIVVEFRVLDLFLPALALIGKEEEVEHLYSLHYLILSKDILNNYEGDVVLELLNKVLELIFRKAFAQEIYDKYETGLNNNSSRYQTSTYG